MILRDQILGFEAKQVIDAEFREIRSPLISAHRRSPLAALKEWFGQILSGRVAEFGNPSAWLRGARRLPAEAARAPRQSALAAEGSALNAARADHDA